MDLGKLRGLSERRVCGECGAEFETNESQGALEQWSDHLTIHQPTGAQWAEAHLRIQAAQKRSGRDLSMRPPASARYAGRGNEQPPRES